MTANLFLYPKYSLIIPVIVVIILSSCSSYKQNIMFKTETSHVNNSSDSIWMVQGNYHIQINDVLEIDIFNKGGEILIDPENELIQNQYTNQNRRPEINFLVDHRGIVKLPMIGEVELAGLTLRDAEEILEEKYTRFYDKLFIQVRFLNKRVFVLGASGGQVVPVLYDNTSLAEIIAHAGGVDNNAKAHNIRLVRGKHVWVADLSTMNHYNLTNIIVQPNDIIYIEPIRKPFVESFRDYSPIFGIVANIISITALIISINK